MTPTTHRQRKWTFRQIVAELPFIPATSNWLKLLCSLLAEPLMFVSSLCIIAETVLPGAPAWPDILTNGPKIVMSLAPEIILPGCFQQAQHAQRNGNTLKGKLLFCLCTLFGLLTLVTLVSFIWHFSGTIANLILFIRCGAGISYTIILNISGHDEHVIDPSRLPLQPENGDRIDQLAQTVSVLTAQLTTVLSITQNNNFLVSPHQEASQVTQARETPLPEALQLATSVEVSPQHLRAAIQPLRLNIHKEQTGLHLLTLVAQQTTLDPDEPGQKRVREDHLEVQEEQRAIIYPIVPSTLSSVI